MKSNNRLLARQGSEEHLQWLKKYWLDRIKTLKPQQLVAEIAQTVDRLEQERIRDPLTGAFNRVILGVVLKQQKWGVVLADIDHFKSVNDGEPDGHVAGDRVLVEFVKLLGEVTGPDSIVARWGGEEFIILIPQIDKSGLQKIAVSVGGVVQEQLAKRAKLARSRVTASLGARLAKRTEKFMEVISAVDKLLYQAKKTGRNKLVMEHTVVTFG